MRIVHLSDPHVQIDYRRTPWARLGWRRWMAQIELVALGRAQRFRASEALLARIALDARALGADHIILSGDLTALAVEDEFAMARRALGPWADDPQRLTVIPGNHDRYTAGAIRTRRFEKHFGHLLRSDLPDVASSADGYPFVRLLGEHHAIIGLDSTRLAPVPGLSFGRVGLGQLRALAAILEHPALRGRALCVAVHHAPLHRNGRPDRITHGLWDAPSLLRLLAGRNASVHHGHIHHRYWHPSHAGRPDVFNAGSATMRGHEGYWVLDYEGASLTSARMAMPGEPIASHDARPAADA